jgi:hypothetical protein
MLLGTGTGTFAGGQKENFMILLGMSDYALGASVPR